MDSRTKSYGGSGGGSFSGSNSFTRNRATSGQRSSVLSSLIEQRRQMSNEESQQVFGSACFASPERLEDQDNTEGLPIYRPSDDMIAAIVEDDPEKLKKLLDLNGGDFFLRQRFDKSMNILNFAVDQESKKVVKFLSENLSPRQVETLVSYRYCKDMQALHQAVHLGTKDITHTLVEEMSADVNSRMANDLTALHCASQTYAGAMGIILLRA
jgi:hypothetical protein